jgi:hypothetical protein
MKITQRLAFFAGIFLLSSGLYAYGSDTLYFCREYKNGKEIGLSDAFSIGKGGDSITVMVKTKGAIREKHISISVDKSESGEFVHIGTHKFDVEPDWDYIFFTGINFWVEGFYRVSLLREDGSTITYNYVTMELVNGKAK